MLASSGGPFPAPLGAVIEALRSRGDWHLAAVALPKLGVNVRLEVALLGKNEVATLAAYSSSTLLSALLLVVDVSQAQDLSDGRPVAAELIGMNDLWDIIFLQ